MQDFLDANFEAHNSGLSAPKRESSLYMFTGLLNTFFLIWCSTSLIPILVSTAILICLENSFWNKDTSGSFVDSFKKSFTLYVESGIRKTTEADIDVLRNEQGGRPVTAEFKAKLRKIIKDHCLRKLQFLFTLDIPNHFFIYLNTAHPEDQNAA